MGIVILAIVSKIATGLFAGNPMQKGYGLQVLQVGSAMVGRGELGFMQISTAYKLGMVSLGVYGGTVWGLLFASIMGPFMFRGAVKFAQGREATTAKVAEPQSATPDMEALLCHNCDTDRPCSSEQARTELLGSFMWCPTFRSPFSTATVG